MCSHDSRGLGHTSRTLAIASKLAESIQDCSILVLTDLPIIGRFKFPQNIDYVRLPGIADKSSEFPRADALNIGLESTLKLRAKIVKSVTKTFRPQLVIVERNPCQLPEVMRRALAFIRKSCPRHGSCGDCRTWSGNPRPYSVTGAATASSISSDLKST